MKIGFLADIHVHNHRGCGGDYVAGINSRCQMIITAIRQALLTAYKAGCQHVIIAGDLFDTTRPSPQIIAAVGEALKSQPNVHVSVTMGNHDRNSDHQLDHALGPLALSEHVSVHAVPASILFEKPSLPRLSPPSADELLLLPFMAEPAKDYVPRELEKLGKQSQNGLRILVLHAGLHDQKVRDANFWAEGSNDAIDVRLLDSVMQKHGIELCVAGNWHGFAAWEFFDVVTNRARMCVQIGALVPTGWDNTGLAGFYGSLVVVDTKKTDVTEAVTRIEIPGPRFVNVKDEAELEAAMQVAKTNGFDLFVRWHTEATGISHAAHTLALLKADKMIVDFDVAVSREACKAQATQAAVAARSAETMAGALSEFIKAMPMPSGVDRNNVFNRCLEYLT